MPSPHKIFPLLGLTLAILNTELETINPCFPFMLTALQGEAWQLQMGTSLNYLGSFFSCLVWGGIADAYGRRPVMLGGCALFVVGNLICLITSSLEGIWIGRLVQGLGASGPIMGAWVIMTDIYQEEKRGERVSLLSSILSLSMGLAGVIGSYVTAHWGWRGNFGWTLLESVSLLTILAYRLPETLAPKRRAHPLRLLALYKPQLQSRQFWCMTGALAAIVMGYWIFMNVSSLLFINDLRVPVKAFGWYQGAAILSFAGASLLLPLVLARVTPKLIVMSGFLFTGIGATGLLVLACLEVKQPALIVLMMMIYAIGQAGITNIIFARLLDLFPESRGRTSALFATMRLLILGVGTGTLGFVYNHTLLPVALLIGLSVGLCGACLYKLDLGRAVK